MKVKLCVLYLPPSTRILEARKTPQHQTEMIKIRALCQLSWAGMDGTGVSRCNQPYQMALSKCPNSGLKSALVPFTGPEDGLRMSPDTLCKESRCLALHHYLHCQHGYPAFFQNNHKSSSISSFWDLPPNVRETPPCDAGFIIMFLHCNYLHFIGGGYSRHREK